MGGEEFGIDRYTVSCIWFMPFDQNLFSSFYRYEYIIYVYMYV